MIKLAAFDIDGTLFDEQRKQFPSSAVEALGLLKANGVLTAAATGRPLSTAAVLHTAGIFPDYLVCSNGHLVIDGEGQVWEDRRFPAELAEAVWHYCSEHQIGLLWKYPDSTYIYRNDPEFDKIFSKNARLTQKRLSALHYDDRTVHRTRGANGGCLACSTEALAQFNEAFRGQCRGVDINGRSSDLLLWGISRPVLPPC